MRGSLRTPTETDDAAGGGRNSIVEQTTDIINRFRNSIVRSRKERLLDEDVQATENIVHQLQFAEGISKETLGKLILQGDSMQRSYRLINQLEKEIRDIADDLNEVKGGKWCGVCANDTLFGFTCLGCSNRRKKKKKKKNQRKPYRRRFSDQLKTTKQPLGLFNQIRGSLPIEHEELLTKIRCRSRERREHPNFVHILNQTEEKKRIETENTEKQSAKLRDYLLENHSLSYGYIDQPDRLINEINMSIHFTQLNTHLDHLLQITDVMTSEVNKHNIVISKIESQAMESGNLLTDYTLLGHDILGSSPKQLQTIANMNTSNLTALGMSTGQKNMLSDLYFFDQYSRTSRLGGIHRSKRNFKDLNEALCHVKSILTLEDDRADNINSHLSMKSKPRSNNNSAQSNLHLLNKVIIGEILTKELDTVLQTFDQRSKTSSPSSNRSKSPEENIDKEVEFIHPPANLPKVSLPASLIVQLHSTWSDLTKDTNYKYKIWRTKVGEETWRRHVQQKRSEQSNINTQKDTNEEKPAVRHRTNSRISVSSTSHLLHRPSIITNAKTRFSRASLFSTSSIAPDNLRLYKAMHQETSETVIQPIKNGIHVEFKLSTKDEKTNQKIVLFDVSKRNVNLDEDTIILAQNKCKRLLAEAKQKIRETTYNRNQTQTSVDRIWFYEDNQLMRNRNQRKARSKFALSIRRHQIPEKFNVDIDKHETKHKCYVQLTDGSTHIYYPSGRLAVLRLRSPICTTLFFDDIDSSPHQFLGLVTSAGDVLLMQPTFHARFITNTQDDNGYLCYGKTGIIEKQFQCSLSNDQLRRSLSIDEKNINPIVLDNTVQFQINSSMQLEYSNSSNIRFAFNCQNEEFQLQLGSSLPVQSSVGKKPQTPRKRINSTSSNDGKQQIETPKLIDEQSCSDQLPMMEELIRLRTRIKDISHNWLEHCRTTLGIMHIDDYYLPDLPSEPTVIQTNPQINRSKSAKEYRSETSFSTKLVQSLDRQQFLLPPKSEANVIVNAIEQFVPRSDTGRSIRKQILRVIK